MLKEESLKEIEFIYFELINTYLDRYGIAKDRFYTNESLQKAEDWAKEKIEEDLNCEGLHNHLQFDELIELRAGEEDKFQQIKKEVMSYVERL